MSNSLRIAEVSRRSGFPPPTLRYYEQLGLVPAPRRSPAGYRAYDEPVLARLAFIARAKALGCSLEEIAQLMPEWDVGRCGPVQDGLRVLAAAKLVEAERRIDQLVAFADELRRVVANVGTHTPTGACDDQCGCLHGTASSDAMRASIPVDSRASAQPDRGPPDITCTLDAEHARKRFEDWKALLVHVAARNRLEGGVRLELDDATPIETLVRLVEAERSCCRFFAFSVTLDDRGLALEVRAPGAANDVIDALFGPD